MGQTTGNTAIGHLIGTALTLAALAPAVATAGPADRVYTPIVVDGETELEFRGGFRDNGGGAPNEHAFVLDIGHAFTPRWFTEIVAEYSGVSGEGGKLEALEWENVFQLTEQGQYWVDVGLFVKYEWVRVHGEPDEFVIGPMFQKDIGRTQANFNLLFERGVGNGAGDEIELDYRAQLRWRGNPLHEFGLQAFGGFGDVSEFGSETSHSVGPAVFGATSLGSGKKLVYDAAVLVGLTEAAPDMTLRFELEYEIY